MFVHPPTHELLEKYPLMGMGDPKARAGGHPTVVPCYQRQVTQFLAPLWILGSEQHCLHQQNLGLFGAAVSLAFQASANLTYLIYWFILVKPIYWFNKIWFWHSTQIHIPSTSPYPPRSSVSVHP